MNKHPILFKYRTIQTNGSEIVLKSTFTLKKKYKFLEVDSINNKLWASNTSLIFSEENSRLNKFNRKFKK